MSAAENARKFGDAPDERVFLWAMQYCTWPGPDDDNIPRPFAGRISPLAFNILLTAVLTAKDAKTLPTVRIEPAFFHDFAGGRKARQTHMAAVDELVKAGLIEVDAPRDGTSIWTFCVDAEVRP
jgi:hypothetical protein